MNEVKPLDEIVHKNIKEGIEYARIRDAQFTGKENSLRENYYYELSKWLEDVRTGERVEGRDVRKNENNF